MMIDAGSNKRLDRNPNRPARNPTMGHACVGLRGRRRAVSVDRWTANPTYQPLSGITSSPPYDLKIEAARASWPPCTVARSSAPAAGGGWHWAGLTSFRRTQASGSSSVGPWATSPGGGVGGAGPRATISLLMAAKARALLHRRCHATTADLAAVALPVLRHRIILTFNAEAAGVDADSVLTRIVQSTKSLQKQAKEPAS